jgi:hypothetical protein
MEADTQTKLKAAGVEVTPIDKDSLSGDEAFLRSVVKEPAEE